MCVCVREIKVWASSWHLSAAVNIPSLVRSFCLHLGCTWLKRAACWFLCQTLGPFLNLPVDSGYVGRYCSRTEWCSVWRVNMERTSVQHGQDPRADQPLQAISCATLSLHATQTCGPFRASAVCTGITDTVTPAKVAEEQPYLTSSMCCSTCCHGKLVGYGRMSQQNLLLL